MCVCVKRDQEEYVYSVFVHALGRGHNQNNNVIQDRPNEIDK